MSFFDDIASKAAAVVETKASMAVNDMSSYLAGAAAEPLVLVRDAGIIPNPTAAQTAAGVKATSEPLAPPASATAKAAIKAAKISIPMLAVAAIAAYFIFFRKK